MGEGEEGGGERERHNEQPRREGTKDCIKAKGRGQKGEPVINKGSE